MSECNSQWTVDHRTKWAIISSYGSRIRLAGESLEWCEAPLDDFERELAEVENAVRKIREKLREIRDEAI